MKNKTLRFIWLSLFYLFFSCSAAPPPKVQQVKEYKVILVHDMGNKYQWSQSFLSACLNIWRSGNVYAVYTGKSTRVWEREINGKVMICSGENNTSAGNALVEKQAEYMHGMVQKLQSDHALGPKFSIIAHGMGGLVSRCYIYKYPGTVSGLVTIGTPHHGSPLAESMSWSGLYFGPQKVVENLRPRSAIKFNRRYPVQSAPLADNGKIYTIRGDADGWDVYGLSGELHLGWEILRFDDWMDSDGLVPKNSSVINGAEHIADFWGYDHYELVQESSVAKKAAEYLR